MTPYPLRVQGVLKQACKIGLLNTIEAWDLREREHDMRKTIKREAFRKSDDTLGKAAHGQTAAETHSMDLSELEKRIAALEAENAQLRAENEALRRQKTVYVEHQKSPDQERREQQHNYFKYSNARGW